MKPKYYTCFPLLLFACDSGDTNSENNDVVADFCAEVVKLQNQPMPEYFKLASIFEPLLLGQCVEILNKLHLMVYIGATYNVLYTWVDRGIIPPYALKEFILSKLNPELINALKTYAYEVCQKNPQDGTTRIIYTVLNGIDNPISNDTRTPGASHFFSANTRQSKPDSLIETKEQWLNYVAVNGKKISVKNLKPLLKLRNEEVNSALQEAFKNDFKINDEDTTGGKTNTPVNDIIDLFIKGNVALDNDGLAGFCGLIPNNYKISADILKRFIPSLTNVSDLAPLFAKTDDFIVDFEILEKIIALPNYNAILCSILGKKFATDLDGDKVIAALLNSNIKLDQDALNKVMSMIDDKKKITDTEKLIRFLANNLDWSQQIDLRCVFAKYDGNYLNFLKTLINQAPDSITVNNILSNIPDDILDNNLDGDAVIEALIQNPNIKLNQKAFDKVMSRIKDKTIKNTNNLIRFLKNNIDQNVTILNYVWSKYDDTNADACDPECLGNLVGMTQKQFNEIFPRFKFAKNCDGNVVIAAIIQNPNTKLNQEAVVKTMPMIDDSQKICRGRKGKQYNSKEFKNFIVFLKNNFDWNDKQIDLQSVFNKCAITPEYFVKLIGAEDKDLASKVTSKAKGEHQCGTLINFYFATDGQGNMPPVTDLNGNDFLNQVYTMALSIKDPRQDREIKIKKAKMLKMFVNGFYKKIQDSTINILGDTNLTYAYWMCYKLCKDQYPDDIQIKNDTKVMRLQIPDVRTPKQHRTKMSPKAAIDANVTTQWGNFFAWVKS